MILFTGTGIKYFNKINTNLPKYYTCIILSTFFEYDNNLNYRWRNSLLLDVLVKLNVVITRTCCCTRTTAVGPCIVGALLAPCNNADYESYQF